MQYTHNFATLDTFASLVVLSCRCNEQSRCVQGYCKVVCAYLMRSLNILYEFVFVSTIYITNGFVSTVDIGPVSDASGASFRGDGNKRHSDALPEGNLQSTESRR